MASTPGVEQRSIDYVPRSERHGTPSSQFTLWFGANMQITAVVDGALAERTPPRWEPWPRRA